VQIAITNERKKDIGINHINLMGLGLRNKKLDIFKAVK